MDLISLVSMDLAFPDRENGGDYHYFESRVAPSYLMRLADGAIADRPRFLGDLNSGGRLTPLSQVTLFGERRAFVLCQIRIGTVTTVASVAPTVRERRKFKD